MTSDVELRALWTKQSAACIHCGAAPKAKPKHRCEECIELTLSMDEQAALALKRRDAVPPDQRKSRVPSHEWPPGRRFCAGCQSMRRVDQKVRLDIAPNASRCRACQNIARRQSTYGITPDQQAQLLDIQNSKCAACNRSQRKMSLACDHSHMTGEARGFLCQEDNDIILGTVHDDPVRLIALAAYLLSPPARRVGVGPPSLSRTEIGVEVVKCLNEYLDRMGY